MPLHDWTRVDASRFHSFHTRWITYLSDALNGGILPEGYYADPEPVTTGGVPDVLTLREPPDLFAPAPPSARSRHIAVRHASGDRVVAFVEIVSPANKDRPASVESFAAKVAGALRQGVHALVLDVLPPGPHDRDGMIGAVAAELGVPPVGIPPEAPLAFASYSAGPAVSESVEFRAVGAGLPELPLWLTPERYVPVPLEPTYQLVWDRSPAWRHLLEPPAAP